MVRARWLLPWALLFGACAPEYRSRISEEAFAGEYPEKLCREWLRCNEEDGPCPFSPGNTTNGLLDECNFNAHAAQQCLDSEWLCGMVEGAVVPADACDVVCG